MKDISTLFNGEYKTTLSDIIEKIKSSELLKPELNNYGIILQYFF